MRKSVLLLLVLPILLLAQTELNTKGFIETRRLFLFDTTNGFQANQDGSTYSFNFNRNFSLVPRVGLAVYTMDFEYSPTFSCKVTSDTTVSAATLFITTTNSGQNNQLYIMYIATDHDFLGVFMPGPLVTYMLNQGAQQMTQSFVFNFKQQISSNSQISNIRVSVYLTGITSSSQLVSNGYPTNHTYFLMQTKVLSSTNYQIDVSVKSLYGDITISQVQYTIVYFDSSIMGQLRYQMDSGFVNLQNYGGTADASKKSITLSSLPYNNNFQNLLIFYGISGLQCKQGASIALSAVHSYYINPTSNTTQVLLTMQTWKLTSMLQSQYNFILYQSLKCGLPGANCDGNCLTSSQPHYVLNGVCNFCQTSCLTCDVSKSNSKCDTCDQTRYLSNSSGFCLCKSGFYDSLQSNVCVNCFPCLTCNLKGVCLSCSSEVNLVLNIILSSCECAPGYYPNYVISGNKTFNSSIPCFKCAENCLNCINSTFCLACNTKTYLTNGTCFSICGTNQKYNQINSTCTFTSNSMFDQTGRLGYEWTYTANQSMLNILLTFSQANVLYYYYQNGQGYSMVNSGNYDSQLEVAQFYYDDGLYSGGFNNQQSIDVTQASLIAANANTGNIFGNNNLNGQSGQSSAASSGSSSAALTGNLMQLQGYGASAFNGSYYGLGEQLFYNYLYWSYLNSHNMSFAYKDQYGIPYGKYNLSTNKALKNPNFVDALSNNLVLLMDNKVVPYSISAKSNNQFALTASVSRSYYGDNAYLILKNPSLIRSGGTTASQLTNVSQGIYIYDCAIPSYISSANSIHDSNSIIVQVLWGLGKYPLFIGFGWIFMPLMLVMQYIMSLNYIDTNKPLNLEMFLSSFSDYRNPSILYNPLRNDMDASVVSHKEMYLSIPAYNRFDRGIDFMKNCFQFFFIPILSFILFLIFVGINKILNATCRKDIPLISQYLMPRLPLHIAAYTLVQALPISFFFFAQLNDTKYSSLNQPNASYPIFNIAMSYAAFFLTCSIPLMVVVHIYFTYSTKENRVKSAQDFKNLFANLLQSMPNVQNKACLDNPLWSGDTKRIITYGFAISVFYLAVLYGFFTSFFISNYPWQIAGLVVATAVFFAFALAGDQFQSKIIKYFWVIFAALMIAFLLLLAGIGSNVSVAPCDQQNLGYLGIGFLYLIILASLIASCYLLWLTCFQIYSNYFKEKKFVANMDERKDSTLQQKPERIKAFQSSTKLKSSYLKNPIHSQIAIGGSKMNIGSTNFGNNGPDRVRQDQQIPNTEDRMIIKEQNDGQDDDISRPLRQKLLFLNMDKNGGYVFITENTKKTYRFDPKTGKYLRQKQPIYIDNNDVLFDSKLQFLGSYENLTKIQKSQLAEPTIQPGKQPSSQPQSLPSQSAQNQRRQIKGNDPNDYQDLQSQKNNPIVSQTQSDKLDEHDRNMRKIQPIMVTNIINVFNINGQEYTKEGQDANGKWIMRNKRTKQVLYVSGDKFKPRSAQQMGSESQENVQFMRPKNVINTQRQVMVVNKQSFISTEIENNEVVLGKNRKIKVNGQEYIDMGEEKGLFKVYNPTKRAIEKITREQYVRMNLDSFDYRVNLNGVDYDYQSTGLNNSIHLMDPYRRKGKIISSVEFMKLKQQNQLAFRHIIGEDSKFRAKVEQAVLKPYVSATKIVEEAPAASTNINNMLLIQSKAGRQINMPENRSKNIIQTETITYPRSNNVTNTMNTVVQNIQDRITTTNVNNGNIFNVQQGSTGNKSNKEVQLVHYSSTTSQKQIVKQSQQKVHQQQEEQEDEETIQKVLQSSPGPFQLFVIPLNKVTQQDGQDRYNEEDNIQKIILDGTKVMPYMSLVQNKYPKAALFMKDLSNNQQFRLI